MSTRPSASRVAVWCSRGARHRAGRAERAGRRVVQLGRRPDPVLAGRAAVVAAGEQDAAVAEQRRGRAGAHLRHGAGRAERAGRRVVQLGCRAAAAGDEDAAVGEQRGRLAERAVLVGGGREPVQLNPGARAGIGVGDGVGAGGPTAIAGRRGPRRWHDGRSTDRLPGRSGVRDVVGLRRRSPPPARAGRRSCRRRPSSTSPRPRCRATGCRVNRIRPSGVQRRASRDPVRGQPAHVGPVGTDRVDVLVAPPFAWPTGDEDDPRAIRRPLGGPGRRASAG